MKKYMETRKLNAFLGPGASLSGTLEFSGTIHLGGKIIGNIVSDTGTVVIEENASVEAEIRVNSAQISGEVIGTIKAVEKIELSSSARITGDLIAKIIRIEAGARFIGNCSTSDGIDLNIKSDNSGLFGLPDT